MAQEWVFVLGTRPELIKTKSVMQAALDRGVNVRVLHTGQHTTLMEGLMAPQGVLVQPLYLPSDNDPLAYVQMAHPIIKGELDRLKPDLVLVQGDTASALAGAMAAVESSTPLAHIEAGVRSGKFSDPWPEEDFRVGIDQLADYCYAATPHAAENLGSVKDYGILVGNPGIDVLRDLIPFGAPMPPTVNRVLVTLHRRESFGQHLQDIITGLIVACREHPDTEFWWPTHPNPHVQRALPASPPANLRLTGPWSWETFVRTLWTSRAILTDSGGAQEEACALGVPCLVARDVTDRPESVALGSALVVGRTADGIQQGLRRALHYELTASPSHCYGDGTAGRTIVDHLLNALTGEGPKEPF